MKDIKDYVFFTIFKDDDRTKDEGISYGVKRGSSTSHELYFRELLGIDSLAFEEDLITEDWDFSCRNIARYGNVMIVNTAVEIDKIEDRMYAIYLPTFPTLFQLKELENTLKEFGTVDLDVAIYGMDEDYFRELRMDNAFDSKKFLKSYIEYHKKSIENQIPVYFESKKVKSYA